MHSPPLPASPFAHQRPRRISFTNADPFHPGPTSPRSPSLSSLQAAATMNASFQHAPSAPIFRRRSSLMTNLQINDPTIPAAGEMISPNSSGSPGRNRRSMNPHHARQPSLGELHQKLEEEQESQANRLLHMIRIQQDQLNALQKQHRGPLYTPPESTGTSALADTPGSTAQSNPFDRPSPSSRSASVAMLPHGLGAHKRPSSLSRQSSHRVLEPGFNSQSGSPKNGANTGGGHAALGPLTEDFLLGGRRDESAFYQAETQMLTRENQMLKLRVKELERHIAELAAGSPGAHQMSGTRSQSYGRSTLSDASGITKEAENVDTPASEGSLSSSPL
ncbi:hypothetical protein B0A48_16200 [Cryoendolithus antarcticus]|uniref:Uncharacterized protein n=1 Tax=Cryoendolithus antarcticus TaxID=1507870 RepID=A0A1V8SFN6_9PEZI|nr:hypothetical protein B0A48_16200 [Cryoendolithus antarcticus]